MTTEETVARWVEAEVGGAVVRFAQVSGGRSRVIYEVDAEIDGVVRPLLVRSESGLGPHAGTRFNLQREAAALRALEGKGVRAPRVYGVSETAIIMQRLGGAPAMPADDALRRRTIRSFCDELARLHAVDIATVALHLPRPADAAAGALADLADWRDSYDRFCVRHAIIDEAFGWLEANAASNARPPVLVHGDAGPGNFMHRDGVLTGLIDFEFFHVGDPHEDLAWIWFRISMINQDREADSYFAHYLAASGLSFDAERCRYFIVQTILRCAVSAGVRQHNDPAYGDARPAEIRGWLANALADAGDGRLSRLPPLPACVS